MRTRWTDYLTALARLHDAQASREELEALSSALMTSLQAEMPDKPSHILAAHLRGRVWTAKLDRMNVLSRDQFRALPSRDAVRSAVLARHGQDLIGAPSSVGAQAA